jgi:hypothetical protein
MRLEILRETSGVDAEVKMHKAARAGDCHFLCRRFGTKDTAFSLPVNEGRFLARDHLRKSRPHMSPLRRHVAAEAQAFNAVR